MAIYKRGRGFELGTTENKSSKWPERDSNLGPPDCDSNALTTRQRCLLDFVFFQSQFPFQVFQSSQQFHLHLPHRCKVLHFKQNVKLKDILAP